MIEPASGRARPGVGPRALVERTRIERAKGVLKARLGLSEAGAHRLLQKTAMDRRLTLAAVADALLAADAGRPVSRATRGDTRPAPRARRA